MTPEEFATNGKAWIEAVTTVLNLFIASFGIIALAVIGVIANIRKTARDQQLGELMARVERQSKRIDAVALSVPATTEPQQVEIVNQPVQVEEKL